MRAARAAGAVWGIIGIVLILVCTIVRLAPHVIDAFRVGLAPLQWVTLVLWCAGMLVSEGRDGFQKRFAPRVSARMWQLANHGRPIDLALAPLYCIGYYGATRKRILTSWALTVGIIMLVALVRLLPQPWRGIVDCGVILGLSYGLVWIGIYACRTVAAKAFLADPEIPIVAERQCTNIRAKY